MIFSQKSYFIGWYCVIVALVLTLMGTWIFFLVLPFRSGWILGYLISIFLIAILAMQNMASRSRGYKATEKPRGNRALKYFGILVIVLDFIYLVSNHPAGLRAGGFIPDVYFVYWSPFLIAFYYASRLSGQAKNCFKAALLPVLLVAFHISLTILGHNLHSARSQIAVMLLWVLIFNRGAWPRILTIALAALYFPMEKLIVSSPFFDIFDRLNFLTAISQLTVVLDQTIKQAAFRSAGLWGFSASEVSRLDLVYPQLMSINGLTYLTAMWGRVGLLVYGALVLTLLLAIGWLIVKDNSERRAMVVLPAWLLITADQYFGLIFYMAWQGYGLTNPPAFVGGFDITLQIFILAFIAFRRVGEGQSQNLKKKAELKLDKALAEDF